MKNFPVQALSDAFFFLLVVIVSAYLLVDVFSLLNLGREQGQSLTVALYTFAPISMLLFILARLQSSLRRNSLYIAASALVNLSLAGIAVVVMGSGI
jgi:hypothetical protein